MRTQSARPSRRRTGFTLVELMIVVAMIAVGTTLGVPMLSNFFADLRLKAAARDVADALRLARIEAIRTGTPHLVFFGADLGVDAGGGPLPLDPRTGGPVPIVILQDDDEDCRIDAPEPQRHILARDGVSWGSAVSGGAVAPGDTGRGDHSNGSSFQTPGGAGSTWVAFGADGIPTGFDAVCLLGSVGNGGGAIYLSSGRRDYAVVMSPLGSVRVHNWLDVNTGGAGTWSD
jgi:prepilin-type N-terminal cleavage/methylation domain-containing protein